VYSVSGCFCHFHSTSQYTTFIQVPSCPNRQTHLRLIFYYKSHWLLKPGFTAGYSLILHGMEHSPKCCWRDNSVSPLSFILPFQPFHPVITCHSFLGRALGAPGWEVLSRSVVLRIKNKEKHSYPSPLAVQTHVSGGSRRPACNGRAWLGREVEGGLSTDIAFDKQRRCYKSHWWALTLWKWARPLWGRNECRSNHLLGGF